MPIFSYLPFSFVDEATRDAVQMPLYLLPEMGTVCKDVPISMPMPMPMPMLFATLPLNSESPLEGAAGSAFPKSTLAIPSDLKLSFDRSLFKSLNRNVPFFRAYYQDDPSRAIDAFKGFGDRLELRGRIAHMLYELLRGGIGGVDATNKGLDYVDVEIALALVGSFLNADEIERLDDIIIGVLTAIDRDGKAGDAKAQATSKLIRDEEKNLSSGVGAVLWFIPLDVSTVLRDKLTGVLINVFTRILFLGIKEFQNNNAAISIAKPEEGSNHGGWHLTPEANAKKYLAKWLMVIKPLSDEFYGILPKGKRQLTMLQKEGIRKSKREQYKNAARPIRTQLHAISIMDEEMQARVISTVLGELRWDLPELQRVVAGLEMLAVRRKYNEYIIEQRGQRYNVVEQEGSVKEALKNSFISRSS